MRSLNHLSARPAPRRRRRHPSVWLALAAVLVAPPAAAESRVVDVRVGIHADHTRVVIELDGPGSHRIARDARGEELSVALDAGGARRRVVSKSPLVSAVQLEPRAEGTVARIALREPGLEFTELRLERPPRIVIDVRRAAVAARKPARAEAPPAAAAAAPPAPQEEIAEGMSPDDPSEPASAPAKVASARDPFTPPAGYEALVAAQRSAGSGLAAEPAAQPGSKAAAESAPAAPAPLAAAPPPGAPAAPASVAPATPSAAPAKASPPPVASPGPPTPALEAEAPSLPGPLASLEPMPILLLVLAAGLIWLAYRRISAARTRRLALEEGESAAIFGDAPGHEREAASEAGLAAAPAGPLFAWEGTAPQAAEVAPEPAYAAEPSPEYAEEPSPEYEPEPGISEPYIAAPAEEMPRPLALVPPPAEAPAPEPEPPAPAPGWQALTVPAAAEAAPAPEEVALPPEIVDRIARLEARIEELRDARERLERFAAAQNEELRVQRAAIARTQRVIRGLSKPEEGAEAAPPPAE